MCIDVSSCSDAHVRIYAAYGTLYRVLCPYIRKVERDDGREPEDQTRKDAYIVRFLIARASIGKAGPPGYEEVTHHRKDGAECIYPRLRERSFAPQFGQK